ncbi:hypothetical protein Landi51_09364 [Colletotrichum acutatum]
MLDDNVDVSAARGVLDVEASVTGGTGVEDRATLNVDVTKVVGCVEEVGGGSGGSGRGEEVGRLAVDEGGAGAPFGRLLIERTRTLTMDDDIMPAARKVDLESVGVKSIEFFSLSKTSMAWPP